MRDEKEAWREGEGGTTRDRGWEEGNKGFEIWEDRRREEKEVKQVWAKEKKVSMGWGDRDEQGQERRRERIV